MPWGGSGAACDRDLSGGQANLDAELDDIQRGVVLSFARRVLRADRFAGVPALGVSAGGDRDEFDCDLLHGAFVGGVHSGFAEDASGAKRVQGGGRDMGTAVERGGGVAGALAGVVLDVSAQDFPEGLM